MLPLLLAAAAALAPAPAAPVPPPLEPSPRPMEVKVVRDPITDAVRAYAIAREDGNRLVVGCAPADYPGVRVTFHSRRWLDRGNLFTGERPIVHRFDLLPPVRMMWDVKDRRGRLADPVRVDAFVGHLMAADRLVIRARDVERRRFDMLFRLRGARPAVEHALAACAAGAAARPR